MANPKAITLSSIERLVESLNQAGVGYLVVGGLAVIAHGHTRLTMNIDLVIQLDAENIRRSIDALARIGYRPQIPVDPMEFMSEETRRTWAELRNMVVFQWVCDVLGSPAVDVFVQEPFDFQIEYERAVAVEVSSSVKVPVVAINTLIEMKRQTGRERDLEDVSNLAQFLVDES